MTTTTIQRSVMVAAFALVAVSVAPRAAEACSCMPTDLAAAYNNSTDVVRVQVLFGVTIGWDQWYIARSMGTYKGCIEKNQWVYIKTASDSAACGVVLQKGKQYLLTATALDTGWSVPVLSIGSCGYNRPIASLTKAERKFLLSRYNCCGETCECVDGSQPVNCFADPCQFADCPSGECVANYCGGCNAEFYDQYGMSVCTPCSANTDCPWTQTCQDGMCVSQCYSDSDCSEDFWCSPTQDPNVSTCKPFQQEGEFCGGFTPIWAQAKCAKGLICTDYPEFVADAPGTCRKQCESNAECNKDQYCSTDGVCREDGSCGSLADCSVEGNLYPVPLCIGYGTCTDGQCGWKCGDPECQDLTDVFFGFCDAVLGVGLVNGECQTISGCDSEGYSLFESMEQCQESCGKTIDVCDLQGNEFGACLAVLGWGAIDGECTWISGCGTGNTKLYDTKAACEAGCGSGGASCKDLGDVDFGECEMALGVGVKNGQCSYISGCDDYGYSFYASMEACKKACFSADPALPSR